MISGYLTGLRKVLGFGGTVASIPLLAALARLEPPWPPGISFVSSALILLSALLAWEWTRRARVRNRRTLILASAILTTTGLIGYLALYSLFVETIPGASERVIRGYTCTAEARQVYGASCPDLPRDALKDAEWEAVVLWTRSSVTFVRLGLAISWLVFTAGLVGAVGAVVAGRKV